MNLNYPEEYYSKSSSEETDDDTGSGRSYECIFCKRGFTTAQALGGHMNIHRKDKANNKNKPTTTFPVSISNKDDNNRYAEDVGFCSEIPSHINRTAGGNNNYYSTVPEVDANNINNYPQVYFPATPCGISITPSHVQYSLENQQHHDQYHHLFGQDWRQRNLSLYTNPFCVGEIKDDKFEDYEEDGLDLELRLGPQP